METGESLLAPELVRRHRKALHAEAKGVAARRAATAGELCGQFGPRSCTAGGDGTARNGAGETCVSRMSAGHCAALGRVDGHGPSVGEGHDPGREPDAGEPHVRFDGRGEETWLGERLRHRQVAGAARESGRRTATPSRYGRRASPRPYKWTGN